MPDDLDEVLARVEQRIRETEFALAPVVEHPEAAEYWAFFPVEKIAGTARAAAMSAIIIGALMTSAADASQCKGLDESACRANKVCAWVPQRIAGETKKANGELHKMSAKAHCRLNTRRPASK